MSHALAGLVLTDHELSVFDERDDGEPILGRLIDLVRGHA